MNAKSLMPGIHLAVPMALYIADQLLDVPTLSSSCANRLLTYSPCHARYWHPRLNPGLPTDDSNASDVGSVAHDMLLGGEGQVCPINPADYPGQRGAIPVGYTNNAIRAARDEIRARGLTPILVDRMREVKAMVAAARAFIASSEIAGVFDSGDSEATMIWQDGDAWCRSRPDWLTTDRTLMLHYKTTKASAEPESFIRRMLTGMGYDIALAFYERGWSQLYPSVKTMRSVILAQEQEAPYACSLIGLSPGMADIAHRKVARAIDLWSQCMKTGVWPAYPAHVCYAEPASWQLAQEEERGIADYELHAEMVQA